MKAIVVYYSLEGSTKYVAEKIAQGTGADILRLEPVKEYPKGNMSKFFWGGKSVVFGEKPKLAPYCFAKEDYDYIIIGTPIWAGSFTPPVKSFLSENDLSGKNIALFACHAGGGAEKCFSKLRKELTDCNITSVLSLIEPGKNKKEENVIKIEEFCISINGV